MVITMFLREQTNKIKQAFGTVKQEITQLKQALSDWVVFMQEQSKLTRNKFAELEKRIEQLEKRRGVKKKKKQ